MQKFGLLLIFVFVASLTFAATAAQPAHPAPARANIACSDALRPQMEADTAVAFQLRSTAYTYGLEQGAALGAGLALLCAGVAFYARKSQHGDPATQKPLSRAASA